MDGCWSRDRVSVTAASLRSGSGPPLSYASVTAGRVGGISQGTGRSPILRIAKKTDPKPASVSAPGAKKDRTTQALADLFARLADVTGGGTPWDRLVRCQRPAQKQHPRGQRVAAGPSALMPWRKCCTAPRPSAGGCARKRRESRPEDRFPPVPAAPGAAQDQDPGEEAPGDNTSSPAGRPEDRTQPAVRHSRRRAVGHREVSVPRRLSVDADDQSSADETDRGPCPLLKNLTALIDELTGQGLTGLARSGGKDLSSATRWPTDCSLLIYCTSNPFQLQIQSEDHAVELPFSEQQCSSADSTRGLWNSVSAVTTLSAGWLPRLEGYYYPPFCGPVSPTGRVMVCIYIKLSVQASEVAETSDPPNGWVSGVPFGSEWKAGLTSLWSTATPPLSAPLSSGWARWGVVAGAWSWVISVFGTAAGRRASSTPAQR